MDRFAQTWENQRQGPQKRVDMKRSSPFYQRGDKTVIRSALNMLRIKGEIFIFGANHKLGLALEGTNPG